MRLTVPVIVHLPDHGAVVDLDELRARMRRNLNRGLRRGYRFDVGKVEPPWEYVGDIAVDSGQIVLVDPSYVIHGLDYDAVCATTAGPERAGQMIFAGTGGVGVATTSGYGDWTYAAYVQHVPDDVNGGRCVAGIKVEFISPDEED